MKTEKIRLGERIMEGDCGVDCAVGALGGERGGVTHGGDQRTGEIECGEEEG